jgi:hypothetical protein
MILALAAIAAALLPGAAVCAPDDETDPAVLLMATARAHISGISSIDQLRGMKDAYRDYYNDVLGNANLDDDQKAQIMAIRDGKIDALDDKISDLEKAQRRRQRIPNPLRIFGGVLRGGKRVLRVVGKGIQAAGASVVRIIRDPKQLMKTAVLMVATGGTSSFKDAVITIVKAQVRREAKKAAYIQLAKIAYRSKALRKAVGLKDFLGIEGNADLEAALNDVFAGAKDDGAGVGDSDWGDIGYEGEGGYDDPDDGESGDIGYEGEGGYDDPDDGGESAVQDYSGTYTLALTMSDLLVTRHPYAADSGFANEAEYHAYIDEVVEDMKTAGEYDNWRNPSGKVEILHDTAAGSVSLAILGEDLVEAFVMGNGERYYSVPIDAGTFAIAGQNADGDTAQGRMTLAAAPDGGMTITGTLTVTNPGSLADVQRTFTIRGTMSGPGGEMIW